MKVELPELGYEYNTLEPYIDEETMNIHHTKHHQAYINKFNAAVEGKDLPSVEDLLSKPESIPEDIKAAVVNHGGGYVNHKLFFSILKKDVAFAGEIKEAIEKTFGSFESFKEEFSQAAATRFGSGWAWLAIKQGADSQGSDKELVIISTPNQDSPLMQGLTPLIGLDVWEHAYYLKYKNKRPDYIEAFFKVINWEKVNELYNAA
jgi:Fe-Mn family superoxide dismutase